MKLFLSISDSAPWNLHKGSSLVPSSILAPLGGIGRVNIFHQVLTHECTGDYIHRCKQIPSGMLCIKYVLIAHFIYTKAIIKLTHKECSAVYMFICICIY